MHTFYYTNFVTQTLSHIFITDLITQTNYTYLVAQPNYINLFHRLGSRELFNMIAQTLGDEQLPLSIWSIPSAFHQTADDKQSQAGNRSINWEHSHENMLRNLPKYRRWNHPETMNLSVKLTINQAILIDNSASPALLSRLENILSKAQKFFQIVITVKKFCQNKPICPSTGLL